MLRYLLDTSIVSAPIAKVPNRTVVNRLESLDESCAIAAPVWHELHYGCSRLAAGKRRSAVNAYLREVVRRTFPVLPYDEVAATWHAEERARLELLGRPTPFVDGQIAAIARTRNLALVTANVRDFAVFEGLAVEDWSHD
jgi:tRNA(fMet)-specific endonuclease VapC